MKSKTNKYYVYFSTLLFGVGIGIVFALEASVESVSVANTSSKAQAVLGDTVLEKGNQNAENLFLDPKFLELQQTVLDEQLPEVTYQEKVQIVKVIPPSNVRVYDIKTGKLVTIVWNQFKLPPAKVKILRSEAAGREPKEIGLVQGDVAGYHDSTVEFGKKYFYSLVSVDQSGKESKVVGPYPVGPVQNTLIPLPPRDVRVALEELEKDNRYQVRISWEDPAWEDVVFINIYRSTEEGLKGRRIAQVKKGVKEYLDTDVDTEKQNEARYYYLLTSVDSRGKESLYNLIGSVIGNDNPFIPSF